MSKIFLCHASEDKPIAEPIQLALVNAGHTVFYDEQSLPPGGDFHERIEKAIRECDLFIFLMTKNSLQTGKYTLTEMSFARERWPSPVGKVLPVNLHELPSSEVPPYLSAVTLLNIQGNPASEVRAAVANLLKKKKFLGPLALTITIGPIVLAFSLTWYRFNTSTQAPFVHNINFNACEEHRILHETGSFRGNSSTSVVDGVLSFESDKTGLVQLLRICPIEVPENLSVFDVEMGRASVTYSTDDVSGAQGSGLGLLFFCDQPGFDVPEWNRWTNEQPKLRQFFSPSPRISSTVNVPRSSFLLQCPKKTNKLTAVIALSDPWNDTEMFAQLTSLKVIEHR